MTLDEAADIFDYVRGRWPHGEVTEAEAQAWKDELMVLADPELAVVTIRQMSVAGAMFRPNVGEFHKAYMFRKAYLDAKSRGDGLVGEVPTLAEAVADPEYNQTQIRGLRDALARIGRTVP